LLKYFQVEVAVVAEVAVAVAAVQVAKMTVAEPTTREVAVVAADKFLF
jgi:hypothetical protein